MTDPTMSKGLKNAVDMCLVDYFKTYYPASAQWIARLLMEGVKQKIILQYLKVAIDKAAEGGTRRNVHYLPAAKQFIRNKIKELKDAK